MILFSVFLASVVVTCAAFVLPFVWEVSRRTQGLVGLVGLTGVGLTFPGLLGEPIINLSLGLWVVFTVTEAKKAWRKYDDARMVRRAEEYQAKIDAQQAS